MLDFAIIAIPLYKLTRKNTMWFWTDIYSEAITTLKITITSALVLVTISYAEGSSRIILVFDASKTG